jgi:hypothetical protein
MKPINHNYQEVGSLLPAEEEVKAFLRWLLAERRAMLKPEQNAFIDRIWAHTDGLVPDERIMETIDLCTRTLKIDIARASAAQKGEEK